MKSLVIVFSCHHQNTEKIATVIADVLGAPVKTPRQVTPGDLPEYSLTGFGSGIYSGRHHASHLDLADNLPPVTNRHAFIFSSCGVPAVFMNRKLLEKNHSPLREKLPAKGYTITGEFGCAGFNTNRF